MQPRFSQGRSPYCFLPDNHFCLDFALQKDHFPPSRLIFLGIVLLLSLCELRKAFHSELIVPFEGLSASSLVYDLVKLGSRQAMTLEGIIGVGATKFHCCKMWHEAEWFLCRVAYYCKNRPPDERCTHTASSRWGAFSF